MLSDELKLEIQSRYNELLERQGFRPRYCQKLMIADIANMLAERQEVSDREEGSDDHISVIEAGTGTGKTIAYLLAALPLARFEKKKLVIATATIALQEQILFKDLPDILEYLPDLDFTFALAKGRRRYVCLSRLDRILQEGGTFNLSLALYDDEAAQAEIEADERELCHEMVEALSRGQWDGDRDRWTREVDENLWNRLSVDQGRCSGRSCSFYSNCSFYKAREQIYRADCIVANHDLVLTDLLMGGGLVLPSPEESIYVFDEAHHLPDKTISHLARFTRINATQTWLEQLPDSLAALSDALGDRQGRLSPVKYETLTAHLTEMMQLLAVSVAGMMQPGLEYSGRNRAEKENSSSQYRFPGGDCTAEMRQQAIPLHQEFTSLTRFLAELVDDLQSEMTEADTGSKALLEEWFPVMAAHLARADGNRLLWYSYMTEDEQGNPPQARWLTQLDESLGNEIQINASPVSIEDELRTLIWSRAWAVVLTSATLAVNGDFALFAKKAGLGTSARYRVLPSPFDYASQGVLRIPAMSVDPRQSEEHCEELAELLPEILMPDQGALVLFTSWWQMRRTLEQMDESFRISLLVQGEQGKAEILRLHRERIDEDQRSYIFGLASFAEGIDLPGKYCTQVVIARIPFSVPDDPVTATFNEWLETRGGNAFMEVSVPDAILKLKQACGRLIRTEEDRGTVTILDRRLLTQRYGRRILDSLPDFRRDF